MRRRNGKRMVHVSFDIVDEFIPRVPKQRCKNEDGVTPRICAATDLLSAIQAIPQAGEVIRTMKRIGLPVIIHAYYLRSESVLFPGNDRVPDAEATGEMWITETPDSVYRIDYELTDSYTILRKDKNGTVEHFCLFAEFKRVKHQDNWRNLARLVIQTEENVERFLRKNPQLTFRAFLSVLDDELIRCMNIEIKDGETEDESLYEL